MNYRKTLADQYLVGKGVEFGALHNPLPVDREKAQVLYADKFPKAKLLKNFKELIPIQDSIVETDVFIDLNQNDFKSLNNNDYDFFIANHVIEHLVNPLKFLENLNSIMNPGSYLYLAVPDKEYNFDHKRELTAWEHLYDEYLNNTTKLSKAHLEDFIFNTSNEVLDRPESRAELNKKYRNWYKRFKLLQLHRKRSIHVHVWNQQTFTNFLNQAIARLNLQFKIVDTINSIDNREEMIYIVQKV